MDAKVSIFGDFIVYDWPVEKKKQILFKYREVNNLG